MRKSLFLLAAVLLFPIAEYAQQPSAASTASPTITRDPQAIAVLNAASQALGGTLAAQIADSVVQATESKASDASAPQATITLKSKGLDQFRMEGTTGSLHSATVMRHGVQQHLGKNGWVTDPSANAVKHRATHLPGLLIGQELARSDLSASYIAAETLNGRSVHHLRLSRVSTLGSPIDAQLTKNSEIDVFVDASTGLVDKISYLLISNTDWRVGFPVEILYDDYRSVQGIQVPYHQQYIYNHGPATDMQIVSVQFNSGLPDTDFEAR